MSGTDLTNPTAEITRRLTEVSGTDPELRPATNPRFGHYQSNVALRLANEQGAQPRKIADEIVSQVDLSDICEPLEVAGPGFINITLRPEILALTAEKQRVDQNLGIQHTSPAQRIVIDYSSPNVAKQMHVGHLRSTIIGDALAHILHDLGNTVIAQNHIGDWGRQFGMLVEQSLQENLDVSQLNLAQAEDLYRRANQQVKDDPDFASQSRKRVVLLQSGDQETLEIWQQLIDISIEGFNQEYQRLHVGLTDADIAGESSYNAMLEGVADDLQSRGIAVIDDGALCVFTDGYPAPLIIRNSDGGFGYAATDLAAVRYRVDQLKADRLIYVVGSPQSQHFDQVFTVARQAGYLPDSVQAEHVSFGQILGPDGKKFSTREGTAVSLTYLLDMAESEASPEVALAAVKYADLQNSLNKDYRFNIEQMIETKGNTGPYLQYAHARCSQILNRASAENDQIGPITLLSEDVEQALALQLTKYGETVTEVGQTLQPHKLCTYLFELAETFSSFYEQCPVIKSTGEVKTSRLGLTDDVRKVLAAGLTELGIVPLDRM